ncbi:hypothetical protein E2562_021811 [Oryza meyeriana var. granulata]|uniref:Rx N-terminal domain-containing protein n=1 Tax=Oryza meyeriana var. granulata TaxID=110450 RepID=A0A6G1ENA2_9ORYZ|nr:hypothetical protein E2562_021811 [Oryza meyeriana var. granulata]
MVSSAVTGEIVSRIITSLAGKLEGKPNEESCRDNIDIERLEMAHIRMEAALAMSGKWQVTDVPMLRWRSKLKRAAQDCDDALRRYKQRAMEDDQSKQMVSNSPFPKRIAHACKSLASSFISSDASRDTSADVQRFERFADAANEFLQRVEFGRTPRQYMFFDPLIGHLLMGKSVTYKALKGSTFYHLAIRPVSLEGRGVEATVGFACQDSKEHAECITLGYAHACLTSSLLLNVSRGSSSSYLPKISP